MQFYVEHWVNTTLAQLKKEYCVGTIFTLYVP